MVIKIKPHRFPSIKQRIAALQKWTNNFFAVKLFVADPIPGPTLDPAKVKKLLNVKTPDTTFDDELLHCTFEFAQWLQFEEREVITMARKRPGKTRPRFLPDRKSHLNRPLYFYVSVLMIIYERWARKAVHRKKVADLGGRDTKFYRFVKYCIKSTGLSEVYPDGSIDKAIQKTISKWLRPTRKYIEDNCPSISLGDIDPISVCGSFYLGRSLSDPFFDDFCYDLISKYFPHVSTP